MFQLVLGAAVLLLALLNSIPVGAQDPKFNISRYSQPMEKRTTVFIPGIMGSKLSDGDKEIWGAFPYDPELLAYRGEQHIAAARPLDGVKVSRWDLDKKAYGAFFNDTYRDLLVEDWFYPFSYDWRASNEISAKHLNRFLCHEVDLERGPVLLVAHSMGGLVLKIWLMEHYEDGCSNRDGKKIDISNIIFVATPHLGAPDVVKTMLSGSAEIFPILEDYFTPDIGIVGLSFDSMYELLPMQHAFQVNFREENLCLRQSELRLPQNRYRVFHRDAYGDDSVVNLYSATVWRRLGLMPRIETLLEEHNIFRQNPDVYLQQKLDKARELSCRLSRFTIPNDISNKVIYLAGKLAKEQITVSTTADEILISDRRIPGAIEDFVVTDGLTGQPKYVYINSGPGDSTVPEDVATNGRSTEARRSNADHIGILSSYVFNDLMDAVQLRADIRDVDALKIAGFNEEFNFPVVQLISALEKADVDTRTSEWVIPESIASKNNFLRIDVNGLANVLNSMTDEQYTIISSTEFAKSVIFQGVLNKEIVSESEAFMATMEKTELQAEDYHLIASMSGISDQERAAASLFAADAYFMNGSTERAEKFYELAGYVGAENTIGLDPRIDAQQISQRSKIGSYLLGNSFPSNSETELVEDLSKEWLLYISDPSNQNLANVISYINNAASIKPAFAIDRSQMRVIDNLSGN